MSAMHSRTALAPRTSGYSDPAFARIADLAHTLAGLVFPPNRQPSAEAGMRRAMSVLHVSRPAELLRQFESPGSSRDAVLAELTVGESYFFRESAQLELLATEILPARQRDSSARPLRVWSAGCASGEEPYTIAIMLREQGWAGPSHILATDIARPRLAAAQRGRYTRWALRGVSDERIARWFTRAGTYYDLAPEILEMVEFRYLNLAVDEYPTATAEEPFDLVLCRNVMIYFDMPTVAQIATGLLSNLTPDGWLVLGASDPPLAHLVPCEPLMTPTGMVYRKPGKEKTVPSPRWGVAAATLSAASAGSTGLVPAAHPVWAPPPVATEPTPLPASAKYGGQGESASSQTPPDETPPVSVVVATPIAPSTIPSSEDLAAAYRRSDYQAAESIVVQMLAHDADIAPATWITYIRSVANQGRLHEAGELNARALELHPLDAELHYLHATLLMEAGWFVDAAAAARRAIYVDRKLVMGHLVLGEALSRIGDQAGARNAFANAVQLLGKLESTESVRAADGVTASRLRQIAALRLSNIEAAS